MEKITLVIMLMFSISTAANVKAAALPDIHGMNGIAIDAQTGKVLYEKNAYDQAFPASITKIMTAMLLEEHVRENEMMEASEWAAGQEASNYHFKLEPGEKISKEDALYALFVMSANDVAVTIAEHIAGSQESFAEMMTKKAAELGATDTHFVTASGLHAPSHYTTAFDMALITKAALDYPNIVEAMGTTTTTLKTNLKTTEVTTANKIMENPMAIGGKTGYTGNAQNTLVTVLEKDGKRVIAVVLKTTLAEEYKDIEIMADYAFEQLEAAEVLVEKGEVVSTELFGEAEVVYLASEEFYLMPGETGYGEVEKEIKKEKLNGETIKKDDVIGQLQFKRGERVIGEVPLVSAGAVDLSQSASTLKKQQEAQVSDEAGKRLTLPKVLLAIFIPFFLYVLFVIVYNMKKRQERKQS